jgi:hypothetical protein
MQRQGAGVACNASPSRASIATLPLGATRDSSQYDNVGVWLLHGLRAEGQG